MLRSLNACKAKASKLCFFSCNVASTRADGVRRDIRQRAHAALPVALMCSSKPCNANRACPLQRVRWHPAARLGPVFHGYFSAPRACSVNPGLRPSVVMRAKLSFASLAGRRVAGTGLSLEGAIEQVRVHEARRFQRDAGRFERVDVQATHFRCTAPPREDSACSGRSPGCVLRASGRMVE